MDNVWKQLMFRCDSAHWNTPKEVIASLDAEFHFTLDPCPYNGTDGLDKSWRNERVYCNPPYGKTIKQWLAKYIEAELVVYLLPARTDTYWFHIYAPLAHEVRFLRGRLCFSDGPKQARAPFPSMLLIYKN